MVSFILLKSLNLTHFGFLEAVNNVHRKTRTSTKKLGQCKEHSPASDVPTLVMYWTDRQTNHPPLQPVPTYRNNWSLGLRFFLFLPITA